MTDDPCPCCGGIGNSKAESERSANRWIADASALEAELPPELQSALGRFLGVESIETLGEWATEVRNRTAGGSITVDDLCLTDEETVHRGAVGDERYHFACFYDAVILAALSERPVDIRTTSPDGTVIEARAVGTEELTVRPGEAVFSFGIDDAVAPPADGEEPSLERGYAAICPYVNAFPSPAAYEGWARSVSAPTVAMPLDGATDLAAELVRR
ncbi:alkylmercury lyase [Natronorubrum sp. JWXQ-INN-674]|uniref:Alkylmercury lyase n=1 Tax=Natronorubrum halalkaliphilum TaxID=2691917 RepID=A0A6B0VID0_9EURY|nr:organomercurial lyase [Natronorubrum halalkaliphilum]MXV61274.1 alkylmercury lyase [Natronorubrum halalkaliphilum]